VGFHEEAREPDKYDIRMNQADRLVIGDYNTVYQTIVQHYPELKDSAYDFSDLIDRYASTFIGREFIFEILETFSSENSSGYFRIEADPGIGKTALVAEIARRYNAPAFFTNAREGRTQPASCLAHLCADIIARFGLAHDHLPARATENAHFLGTLLSEAVAKLQRPLWLAIDAIAESDEQRPGRNPLFLPDHLPQGVFVVITNRPGDYPLVTDARTRVERFHLNWNDPQQQHDIETYIRRRLATSSALRQILVDTTLPISAEAFVIQLKTASQGNFMYLDYVLADIEAHRLGFAQFTLDQLPLGLKDYYAQFWSRLQQAQDEEWDTWDRLHRPIITMLAVAGEPVTVEWIAEHTGLRKVEIEERGLRRWQHFLRSNGNNTKKTWHIFHQSFADFLAEKIDLAEASITLTKYYLAHPSRWTLHGGYAQRHLTMHLFKASEQEALYELVDSHVWYTAQETADPSGTLYLADLLHAWSLSERLDARALEAQTVAASLAREARYALATASLHSLSANLPSDLLVALLTSSYWSDVQVLAIARQNPNPVDRSRTLAALSPHLPQPLRNSVLREILASIPTIQDEQDRCDVLVDAVPVLIADYSDEVLSIVSAIDQAPIKAKALVSLAAHLPEKRRDVVLQQALDFVGSLPPDVPEEQHESVVSNKQEIPDAIGQQSVSTLEGAQEPKTKTNAKSTIFSELAVELVNAGYLEEALCAAQAINDESLLIETLEQLGPSFAESGRVEELLEAASHIHLIEGQVRVFLSLLDHLTGPIQYAVAHQTLSIAKSIDTSRDQFLVLACLIPYLPIEERLQLLHEAEALAHLSTWIPEEVDYRDSESIYDVRTLRTNDRLDMNEILARHNSPDLTPAQARMLLADHYRRAYGDVRDPPLGEREKMRRRAILQLRRQQLPYQRIHRLHLIATLMARFGDPLEAIEVAQQIEHEQVRAAALYDVSSKLAVGGHITEAVRAAQLIVSDSERIRALADVAALLPDKEGAQLLYQALQDAEALQPERERIDSLITICKLMRGDQRKSLLIKLAQETRVQNYWEEWGALLAEMILDLPEEDRESLLRENIQQVRIRFIPMVNQTTAWTSLVERLMEIGCLTEALYAARVLLTGDHADGILARLVLRLRDAGLIIEAVSCARSIRKPDKSVPSLLAIIPHVPPLEAADLAREAYRHAYSVNDHEKRMNLLADIAAHQSGEERMATIIVAVEAANSIPISTARGDARRSLGSRLVRLGYPKQALQLMRTIGDDEYQDSSLATLISKLAAMGYSVEASNLLWHISGNSVRSRVTATVISWMAANYPEKARDLAQTIEPNNSYAMAMLAVAPNLPVNQRLGLLFDLMSKARSLVIGGEAKHLLAVQLAELGFADEAMNIIDHIYETGDPRKAGVAVVEALIRSGYPKEASHIAQSMSDEQLKLEALIASMFHSPIVDIWEQIYAKVLRIRDKGRKVSLLGKVAEHLTDRNRSRVVRRAAKIAGTISHPLQRAEAFASLLSVLPKRSYSLALNQIRSVARSVTSLGDVTLVIEKVIPKLPSDERLAVLQEILVRAENIVEPILRSRIKAAILSQLPEVERTSIVYELLVESYSIENLSERAKLLATLVPELVKLPLTDLHRVWQEVLHSVATHTRGKLLEHIAVLTPVIVAVGGPKEAVEIGFTIRQVSWFWP
jgi:hypothetical protein